MISCIRYTSAGFLFEEHLLNYRYLFLLSCALFVPITAMESKKKNVANIPEQARATLQRVWAEERQERMSRATKALGLSFATTYVFGLLGVAGHFNWINESMASYSKLFFKVSMVGAAATWHFHNERTSLIKKKYLSECELQDTFDKMQAAKKFQAGQV
jgi:hypothetical protein